MNHSTYLDKLLNGTKVEWTTIDQIFNIKRGYIPSRAEKEGRATESIPFFRLEDIKLQGRVLDNSIFHIDKKRAKGEPFPPNSFLVSTLSGAGGHALVTVEHFAAPHLINLQVKEEYVDISIKFIYYYLFILDELTNSKAIDNNSLLDTIEEYKNYPFPILSLEEQDRIISTIANLAETLSGVVTELVAKVKQMI